jgi:hypothetical protein
MTAAAIEAAATRRAFRKQKEHELVSKPKPVTPVEIKRVEAYLRRMFNNRSIEVRGREKAADAAEIYVGGDFFGIVSKDTEDGETSFQLTATVLEEDLNG